MMRNRGAHRLALRGIRDRLVHRPPGQAHRAGGHRRPRVVKGAHGNFEALALLPEHVACRHDDVLKSDAACVGAPLSHIDLLASDRDARGVAVDDEAGEAGRGALARIRLRQHEEPVGEAAIRDPHLLSVQHPIVAFLHCRRREAGNIRAGARLGHAVSGLQRRLRQTTQVLLLLLRRACDDHRRRGQAVGLHGGHDAGASVRQLLADEDALEAAQPEAAAVLWNMRVDQAKLPRFREHILWELHRLVILGRDGRHFVDRKGSRQLLQGILLLGKCKRVAAHTLIVVAVRGAESSRGWSRDAWCEALHGS
mmetsp:Transcript_26069/g.66168  ORF Transcript_26069/g.66168 Transcript_26069/m.66168 type:complete len:310 (+) Transcript_26069:762-1691(+)